MRNAKAMSFTTRHYILAVIAMMALLGGCASNTTHRTNLLAACAIGDKTCDASLELNGKHIDDSPVALTFVEINDQGLLRERGQLDRVRKLITRRGQRGNQTVMLFVHGWHNNALADNGNVETFRRLLQRYSNQFPENPVTGVYVGWRGDSWLAPSELSFWNRKDVSIEVGQGALVDILSVVEKASIDTGSRMLSIGHSFGGSALFNATRSVLLSRLDSPPAALAHERFPMHAAVGDLIVIVNPAFEAMQFWPLHSATLDRLARQAPELNRGPRLVILQGQKDWATRFAFPAGRSLSIPFESHVSDSDSMDSGRKVPEWDLDLYAIGHFKELNTHDLLVSSDPGSNYSSCGRDVDPHGFTHGEWISPNAQVQLKPRSNFVAGDPFWVIYDTVLSSGHNDLEDGRLTCMVADLLNTNTKFEPRLFNLLRAK
jgi:hypothetical protein